MQTARGERFGPGGLIPSTPTHSSAEWAKPPDAADIALACYMSSIEGMQAEEVALLAPDSTITEMRKRFPHHSAVRLDEAETKLRTLFRIRRRDANATTNKIHKRSRT